MWTATEWGGRRRASSPGAMRKEKTLRCGARALGPASEAAEGPHLVLSDDSVQFFVNQVTEGPVARPGDSLAVQVSLMNRGATLPAGSTDILVSYTWRIAFQDSGQQYGLAAAISTVIFLIVAAATFGSIFALGGSFAILIRNFWGLFVAANVFSLVVTVALGSTLATILLSSDVALADPYILDFGP